MAIEWRLVINQSWINQSIASERISSEYLFLELHQSYCDDERRRRRCRGCQIGRAALVVVLLDRGSRQNEGRQPILVDEVQAATCSARVITARLCIRGHFAKATVLFRFSPNVCRQFLWLCLKHFLRLINKHDSSAVRFPYHCKTTVYSPDDTLSLASRFGSTLLSRFLAELFVICIRVKEIREKTFRLINDRRLVFAGLKAVFLDEKSSQIISTLSISTIEWILQTCQSSKLSGKLRALLNVAWLIKFSQSLNAIQFEAICWRSNEMARHRDTETLKLHAFSRPIKTTSFPTKSTICEIVVGKKSDCLNF